MPMPNLFGFCREGAVVMKDSIRRIAFRIYQDRMRKDIPGDALSDWLAAEKEFNANYRPRRHYTEFQRNNA